VDKVWSKSHEHRKDGPMGIKHLENKINFISKQKKTALLSSTEVTVMITFS
jgi:hypothetical protein